MFDKYHPGYFGKTGMRQFHRTKQHSNLSVINLDKISSIISKKMLSNKQNYIVDTYKNCKTEQVNELPQINVSNFGFGKVLAKGKIPKFSYVVKAKKFSASAQQKILSAGGAIVVLP